MELNEELKKRLEKALYIKEGATTECPICHGIDWNADPFIFEYEDFQYAQNRSSVPERVYPIITAYCERCGYCISFNAIKLGLVDQKNNQDEAKTKHKWRFEGNTLSLKWLSNSTRNDKIILLLTYFVVFIIGVEVGSNVTFPIISSSVSTIESSKFIGWLFNFLGVLLLGLSAYLIDVGSRNPLIDVNERGSISMTTSTKRSEEFQHNKKVHKFGVGALIFGIILSAVGLILTLPI